MSDVINETIQSVTVEPTPVKRGPGRPPGSGSGKRRGRPFKTAPANAAPPPSVISQAQTQTVKRQNHEWPPNSGYAVMPDEEMEQYGGDLDAHSSWSKKASRPLATWRDSYSTTILPDLMPKGMLVNRHAPEKLFHFVFLKEDGSDSYQRQVGAMNRRGYKPCTVEDWYVHSLLRSLLLPEDGTGRLTLYGTIKGGATVVYYQGESDYNRVKAFDRRLSDDIQYTAEQKLAQTQEQLNRDGFGDVRVSTEFSDY